MPLPDEIVVGANQIVVTDKTVLADAAKVYLEDLDLEMKAAPAATNVAGEVARNIFQDEKWQKTFAERFAIVSDDVFGFLVEMCTVVSAHIRIDDNSKTVADGALWYEEYLPPESILTAPLTAACRGGQSSDALFGSLASVIKLPIQIGGNATTGCGLVQATLTGGGSANG